MELFCSGYPSWLTSSIGVEGARLVRVLAVTHVLDLHELGVEGAGEVGVVVVCGATTQVVGNGAVITGGMLEGLDRQVETGSAITWKYPSVLLEGNHSTGEFYSVALTNNCQQADTGTKMVHIGENTSSTIISKGISAGRGQNAYRGLVKVLKGAKQARNYSQCDSLLMGDRCGAHTFPYVEVKNPTATIEHEATTSKIGEDQLFYCRQRGLSEEDAVSMIVNGFCKEVFRELPMEFAVEAQKLLGISLEGAVG